eukprot:TRINITY_DN191_c0_g1_i1.p1 TRINITY_DN191_c0_g1~~TRINITY_DN191_c0_g1_i1.p1  ORF type:complete len:272 (-),score=28.80 TRINITY_DN191_c0_g1_i1:107-922(-)
MAKVLATRTPEWHLNQYRLITIMDGDVGETSELTCSDAQFSFPNVSLYFNHTSEYPQNMDSIQAATGISSEPCAYEGWYENTYEDRPGGSAEFVTMPWMDFNGSLYYSDQYTDWVVYTSIGFAVQIDGSTVEHPDWIGPFVEGCALVQVSCDEPPEVCPEYMEVSSFATSSTDELNLCIVLDDSTALPETASLLDPLLTYGLPANANVLVMPLSADPSAWLTSEEAIEFTNSLSESGSVVELDLTEAMTSCIDAFDDRGNQTIHGCHPTVI